MKKLSYVRLLAAASATLVLTSVAQAHPGDVLVFNCASGFFHPLLGLDHLVAMIAVGVWASQLGGHARWSVPAAFVGVMALGAALSGNGFFIPGLEPMIAASVLALGLLIAAAIRLTTAASVSLVTLFALLHGFAHGAEIPARTNALSYGVGFILATIALHGVGLALGSARSTRSPNFLRVLGAACAATGFVLLLS